MRALAFAALALAAAPAGAQVVLPTPLPEGTLLEITATGRTQRVPDVAVIRAGVVTSAPSAAQALADNSARVARVLAALQRAGVAGRDVQTASIQLQPQYRYGENLPPVITGYQASNSVSIRLREVARAGAILDALVREGANQIDGPNLNIDRPEAAEDKARTDAVAKARARAELYAKAAGLRVERIVSITEGGSAPPPMPMVMMRAQAADAATKIAPGEQEVALSVTVRFLLK